jgi:flavin reductase (DIM6/NTAB) family NADH-FMN oxidoreductase RutF
MEYRHDMLIHGVYVVAATHHEKRGGLTVAWATQVARNRILICVGEQSTTRELILASQAFGLSILTRQQIEIARVFGTQSSRDVDKFEGVGYHTLETSSPLLDDCAATFDCRVVAVHDEGSKKLIIGHIVAAEFLEQEYEPFIYRVKDY